jgi:hypothetical protein
VQIREPYRDGIAVYHHPNPQIRSYLVEEDISSFQVEHLKSPLTAETLKGLAKLGRIGAQVAKEVLELREIQEIRLKPKEVWVKKAESASWNEIEEKIRNILKRAIRKKKIHLINS